MFLYFYCGLSPATTTFYFFSKPPIVAAGFSCHFFSLPPIYPLGYFSVGGFLNSLDHILFLLTPFFFLELNRSTVKILHPHSSMYG